MSPFPPIIVAAEPTMVTLAIFAHNVAVGAALCATWECGLALGDEEARVRRHGRDRSVYIEFWRFAWHPGCSLCARARCPRCSG